MNYAVGFRYYTGVSSYRIHRSARMNLTVNVWETAADYHYQIIWMMSTAGFLDTLVLNSSTHKIDKQSRDIHFSTMDMYVDASGVCRSRSCPWIISIRVDGYPKRQNR